MDERMVRLTITAGANIAHVGQGPVQMDGGSPGDEAELSNEVLRSFVDDEATRWSRTGRQIRAERDGRWDSASLAKAIRGRSILVDGDGAVVKVVVEESL
jgi:hypothetical protein